MPIPNILHGIENAFSNVSDWLYALQNARHGNGASNCVLGTAAVVLVGIGLFVEWLYLKPQRRRILARLWYRLPWLGRFLTGYERTSILPKKVPEIPLPKLQRVFQTPSTGLPAATIAERVAAGLRNDTHVRTSRTYRQIFIANTFTRFNALIVCLYVIILAVGAPQDSLFGIIVVLNTLIGIVQELRAKWTLDRLAISTAARVQVIRDGKTQDCIASALVQDDLCVVQPGTSLPVDGVVVASMGLDVHEGLVTGESEPVHKWPGDPMYSGSVVLAGEGQVQAVRVGDRAYAHQLAAAVRQFTLAKSEIRQGINHILRYVTWFLVPTAILLFITQVLFNQNGWRDALSASSGGVVNMVPDGLVLLTSVVMALAVIRLGQRHVLIQELPAVEMLARVDVLCVDKTGTLTEGKMAVDHITVAGNELPAYAQVREVLGMFASAQQRTATLEALAVVCPAPQHPWAITQNIAFTSARKWSALRFAKAGTWVLGAPENMLAGQHADPLVQDHVAQHTVNGKRVLLLAQATQDIAESGKELRLPRLVPVALVVLQEQLREGVRETLQYFRDQGVRVKILSGDNPSTVASIARAAGVPVKNRVAGNRLPEDVRKLGAMIETEDVFGRVLPEQKQRAVQALQQRGHTVAMIGDGINDVLAIKQADFSIAMGSGSEASRGTAQLVLLQNTFAVLPEVIAEGRRIIANIERTANLFITKTAYVITVALAVGVALSPFPFLPRHLTLIGFFTVGVPALFLSFRKNAAPARPGFVSRVFSFSLPAGTIVASAVLVTYALVRQFAPGNVELARTAATLCLFGCGLILLSILAQPFTRWLRGFFIGLAVGMALTIILPTVRDVFGLVVPPVWAWCVLIGIVAGCAAGLRALALGSVVGKVKI